MLIEFLFINPTKHYNIILQVYSFYETNSIIKFLFYSLNILIVGKPHIFDHPKVVGNRHFSVDNSSSGQFSNQK